MPNRIYKGFRCVKFPQPDQEKESTTIPKRIYAILRSIKAWLDAPRWPEQLMIDLMAAPASPQSNTAKYIKSLEDLVAEQKKTIKSADVIVEQAQLSAKNQADITPQLIAEVNRLRVANATLSGAYHWVAILGDDGKKKLVRFNLN